MGTQFEVQKKNIQETYFPQKSRFRIKVRNKKYENKDFCS